MSLVPIGTPNWVLTAPDPLKKVIFGDFESGAWWNIRRTLFLWRPNVVVGRRRCETTGPLPLDHAPAESPFPCGGLVSDSAPGRGGTGIKCRSAMHPPIVVCCSQFPDFIPHCTMQETYTGGVAKTVVGSKAYWCYHISKATFSTHSMTSFSQAP